MFTMQSFYGAIFGSECSRNPYLDSLIRLTRISAAEVALLKSNISWDMWG